MPKLTAKQMREYKQKQLEKVYNMQFNEIFKLHKFLIEHKLSNHTIDSGNPIDDAIKLIKELTEKRINNNGN